MTDFSLLKQVPQVLRARGFRLYTQGGGRLIDLWLNGGAAVLGHTPPSFLREIKNTASRGLYAPLPHFAEGRYLKALAKLLPGHCFRLYAAPPPELVKKFLEYSSHKDAKAQRKFKFWRPFIDIQPRRNEKDFILETPRNSAVYKILVLPGIQSWRDGLPMGLCVAAAESEEWLSHLPQSDILPPVLLAAATRGAYDLIASPQRGKPVLPRAFKALRESACPWKCDGIYLTLKKKPSPNGWAELFKKFLDAGFLLPPVPEHPLVLPGEMSQGEDAKLHHQLLLCTETILP